MRIFRVRGASRSGTRLELTRFVQAAGPIILGVRRLLFGGWPPRIRMLFAGGVAALVASTVALVPDPAVAGAATPCVRSVALDAQQSAGEGAGELVFTVRSGGCAVAGSVDYTVTSGTAEAGLDFVAISGTLRWNAGDLRPRPVGVMVVPDVLVEAALESFQMWLRRPSAGVSVTGDVGLGRILDDDAPHAIWAVDDLPCGDLTPNQVCTCLPQLAEEPISVRDNASERWVRALPAATGDVCAGELSLSAPLPEPAAVQWSTRDGTAVAGVDYAAVTNQVLKVPAGTSTVDLPVQILPPRPGTPVRWFTIQVEAVSPGVLADPVAVVALPRS